MNCEECGSPPGEHKILCRTGFEETFGVPVCRSCGSTDCLPREAYEGGDAICGGCKVDEAQAMCEELAGDFDREDERS